MNDGGLEPVELDKLVEGLHPAADWRDPDIWYAVDGALRAGDDPAPSTSH